MKIFVTGGAGYIGSHTVKELIKQNHEVLIYDNLSDGHKEAVDKKAKLIVGDISDARKLNKTFRNFRPDIVIHFAGFIIVPESVKDPAKYYYNNFCFGINLLECMAKNRINNIIYSSSAGVYGNPEKIPIKESDSKNPVNTYGKTKLIFEGALDSYEKAYGLKYIALRYFNAAGASSDAEIGEDHSPESHIIPLIIQTAMGKQKEFKVFGNDYPTKDGTCIRDYIHVDDLATAHVSAVEKLIKTKQSAIYNLGLGKGFSNLEIIKAIEKVSGKKIETVFAPRREGDPAQLIADPTLAKKELNFKPKYDTIERIIETAWNWHSKNPKGFQ